MCYLALAVSLLTSSAFGESSHLRMISDAEAEQWYGVGRLNILGEQFCSVVLVSEIEVLTAAHCLFRERLGTFSRTEELKVELGARQAGRVALRGVVAFAVLEEVMPTDWQDWHYFLSDIALLRLDAPVPKNEISPFLIRNWRLGETVSVVGYGKERPYIPSILEGFRLQPVSRTVAMINSSVQQGMSGGAVVGQPIIGSRKNLVGIAVAALSESETSEAYGTLVIHIGTKLSRLRSKLLQ